MGDEISSSVHVVTELKVARVLLHPERSKSLVPFLTAALTVGEAAQRLGLSVNTMYMQVQRLLRLGLLQVVGELPRSGRALKRYQSPAQCYFIPFELMPVETLHTLHEQLDRPFERRLRRGVIQGRLSAAPGYGYEISVQFDGQLHLHPATQPGVRLSSSAADSPATINLWDEDLRLDFADAKAFQAELYALYRKYQTPRGAQRYLLRLGLAPLTV
ncbi:hypothetical protein DESA109040_10810 [Deinococcus saxicola]|uniref:hypothetical protein n=1 Tax=Deinococcus saxicola TaxID=249406 RepID=UPI0039EF902A